MYVVHRFDLRVAMQPVTISITMFFSNTGLHSSPFWPCLDLVGSFCFLFTFQAFWCRYDWCPPLGWFRMPVILSFSFLTLETEGLAPGTWAYRSLTLQDGLTSHLVTPPGPQLLLVVCFDSWWNLRPSMCSVLWGWKDARATFEVKAALGPITASCLGGSWRLNTLGALNVSR